MLNRRNRIGDSEKIEKLAKAGNVFKSDFLLFRYTKAGEIPSQFAVNVSKRIDNRAVVRNRLRRQINEALRLNLSLLPDGYRILVSARSSAAQKAPTFEELSKAVIAFFNTLKVHAK
jgi:ribonuclease P protein component